MKALSVALGTSFVLLFNLAAYILVAWLLASGISSFIKQHENKCGTTYGIEKYYVEADLFCGAD